MDNEQNKQNNNIDVNETTSEAKNETANELVHEETQEVSFFSRMRGKAEVSDDITEKISFLFSEEERVIESFKFIVDEIVITNYGIYMLDRKLIRRKNTVEFIAFYMISGVLYKKAGRIGFSNYVTIKMRNGEDVKIKIAKNQDFIANDIIKTVKEEFLIGK